MYLLYQIVAKISREENLAFLRIKSTKISEFLFQTAKTNSAKILSLELEIRKILTIE